MRAAIAVCLVLAACGKKTESSSSGSGSAAGTTSDKVASDKAATNRFAKKPQSKVSAVCQKARESFGYGAECIETELTELASPAGTITRVMKKGDPTGEWFYVLAKPDGTMFAGGGGTNGTILDEVMKGLDAKNTAPEILAKLEATLDTEAAVVRCLPGTDDKLPQKDGKDVECMPPAITMDGGKTILTYTIERFPHPRLLNRTDHSISSFKTEVKDHELSFNEGTGLVELPADAPLPQSAPPLPTMTAPHDWVATPVPAADDVNKALCALAVEKVSGMKGRQCKAYAYPSLESPAGSVFFLANDAGQRQILALKKPDGTMVVGYDALTDAHPMKTIVKSYDPKTMPAEKVVALHLFMHHEAARILCLPGSKDVIPDHACDPPTAENKGEDLVIKYIVEEVPAHGDHHGNVSDPAVRAYTTELTPGGGSSGGGSRLVDMRDP
ncbi:MAG: hypothetical protein ACKV2T_29060 [Kofleriaceae bacterium]